MAFPSNPTDGQQATLGPRTFQYNAAKGRWTVFRAPSTGSAAITQAALDAAVANVGGGTETVSEITELTLSGNEVGDMKFIESANKLFIWNGNAWQNINLSNEGVTLNYGGEGFYKFDNIGTPVVITLDATDAEGISIEWTYNVTSGLVGNTATIVQNDNIFTITPSTDEANSGSFQLTFIGTDGENTVTAVNDFQLVFEAPPGEVIFNNSTTNTWTVPNGVTNVSVVCIGAGGGGALQQDTNNSAGGASTFGVPGESFYFGAGGGGAGNGTTGGAGGSRIGAYGGGGNGGSGASGTGNSGGGGAGGYTGNGGSSTASGSYSGSGGGVGYYGQGANGQSSRADSGISYAGSGGGGGGGGVCNSTCGSSNRGYHGSGGGNADVNYIGATYAQTSAPGGGGASAGGGGAGGGGALAWKNNITVTPGQQITVVAGVGGYGGHPSTQGGWGLVRIVWGDSTVTREFPTTNVGPTSGL